MDLIERHEHIAAIVRNNREFKRYTDLIETSRLRRDAAADYVSPDVEVAVATGQDVFAASPDAGPPAVAAQADVAEMAQPVTTPEDNQAWIKAAAEEMAGAAGVAPEARQAVAEQMEQIVAAVEEQIPEARQVAEQLGLVAEPEAAAPSPADTASPVGRKARIIFPAESGMPPLPGRYALVELDTLQPSHTFRNYTPNPAWTAAELAQQRNYDSGAMEAVRQSIELDPLDTDAVFNPGNDAVNGPPIVTADGKVLGGNNRAHRIYNRYQADNYKDALVWHLSTEENTTGIAPKAAMAMERPVLVRVADNVDAADIPGLIGALNADFTNRRDPANLAANRGMRVGGRTLAAFAGIGEQSVAAYLDSPAVARRVLQAMVEDGALASTDLPGLYDFANDKWLGDGRSSGKAQVEQALFGAILPDSRLLDDLSDGMKKKLVRALPGLIRMKRNNAPELADLFAAIGLHNEYQAFKDSPQAQGLKPAARLELFRKPNQADLFTGETPAEKSGPAWDMFLELNRMKTQREVADFFTGKANEIAGVGRGLFDLQQGPVNEKRAKFDAAPTLEATTKSISDIPDGTGFAGRLVEWARKKGILGTYTNADTGWNDIEVTATSIRDVNRHKAGPGKLAILEVVPNLIQNGIYLETTKRNEKGLVSHIFGGKVSVDGMPYVVGFSINEDTNGKRYYNHELTEIKKASGALWSEAENAQVAATNRKPIRSILRKHLFVNSDASIIDELYQPAYHGTPHRFDKFSLDAIGSGEGNQAYGWGLYFAENDEIAEAYRKGLTQFALHEVGIDGKKYQSLNPDQDGKIPWKDENGTLVDEGVVEYQILENLLGAEYNIIEAIKSAAIDVKMHEYYRNEYAKKGDAEKVSWYDERLPVVRMAYEKLSGGSVTNIDSSPGQLYKVEVPESEVLLDWETTFENQPKSVKNSISALARTVTAEEMASIGYKHGEPSHLLTLANTEGRVLYNHLAEIYGSEKASRKLNEFGIKGIRYLDGNSRRAGEGTHNYVIFDDTAIEILETYYQGDLNSPRGAIRFQPTTDAPTIIRIFQNADVSTVVHELNHLFVFDLQQMVAAGRGGEQARAHLAILTAFAGGKLDRAGYEKIAQAWERYAMEGKAPSPELVGAFEIFRDYIGRVYANAVQDFGVEPPAEVRAVFDRFLATDQQIADARRIEEEAGYWFDHVAGMDEAAKERLRALNKRRDAAKKRAMDAEGGGAALGQLGEADAAGIDARKRGKESGAAVYGAIARAKRAGGFDRGAVTALIGRKGAAEIARIHGDDIYGHGADLSDIADAGNYKPWRTCSPTSPWRRGWTRA